MTRRYEYFLTLTASVAGLAHSAPDSLRLRAAHASDTDRLAELMIEAYRGTIDYDGETLADAVREVKAYLAGERGGEALLDISRLAFAGSQLAGACLAADWHIRQVPLIAYVMTRAEWKRHGVGRQVLEAVLEELRAQGHREVRAVITQGNTASEGLFRRLGFQRAEGV